MADVFISYKREDREYVRLLVRGLQECGFTVWWDNRLEWGESWAKCIKRALNSSKCTIVVWTPKSVASDGTYVSPIVEAEALDAGGRNVLLPVRVGRLNRPFPHAALQEEDLTGCFGSSDALPLARIAGRLSKYCGKVTRPDPEELSAWLSVEETNNATAFREFARTFPNSRFAIDAEARAAETEMRSVDIGLTRDAANKIVRQFANEVGKPDYTQILGLGIVEKTRTEPFNRAELFKALRTGARVVLEAEPGGGKTTTLLDCAGAYSEVGEETLGVFLRLKEFSSQGGNLFEHLADLESSRLISCDAWHQLALSGSLSLFCDGWNELDDAERTKIGSALNVFARTYPQAGLVVGTRPLGLPPLRGDHMQVFLQRLSQAQVRDIIEARTGQHAPAALAELRRSAKLLELVRTPFFLVAFCVTRSAGTQPTSRYGLIEGMLDTMAAEREHAKPLREMIGLHHNKYLAALAEEMMLNATTELTNDEARIAVNRISNELVNGGIESEIINADTVLGTLRDHHCLIERGGNRPVFHFQHQLIQEWYAAEKVYQSARRAFHDIDTRDFLEEEILNQRFWTESVLLAIERPTDKEGHAAIAHMVLRSTGIDVDFAAEMIDSTCEEVWKLIAPSINQFVHDLKTISKLRALRFIMKCGRAEFFDVVWEAIRNERDEHAAQALHVHRFDHPAVLGKEWKTFTTQLQPRGRKVLLSMLASNSGLDGAKMAAEVALVDPDPNVQAEVAEELFFFRFDEQLSELLRVAEDDAWEVMATRNRIEKIWLPPWRDQAVLGARRAIEKMDIGPTRILLALHLRDLGEDVGVDLVDELLRINFETGSNEDGLFKRVSAIEPVHLSNALIENALSDRQIPFRASRYIKADLAVDQRRLLAACRTKSKRRHAEILAPLLDVENIEMVLSEYLTLENTFRAADYPSRKEMEDTRTALSDTLYNADKNMLAQVILNVEPEESDVIGDIADVIMRSFGRYYHWDERPPLDIELQEKLIALFKKWAGQVVQDPISKRRVLHKVSEALVVFPNASLLEPLRNLIEAELEIWRQEKADFQAAIDNGKRPPSDSGARLSYAYRYGQNTLSIALGRNVDETTEKEEDKKETPPELISAVINVMAEYLRDPDFGDEAARVIANLSLDPILSVGKKNSFGDFDVSIVEQRCAERARRGPQPVNPNAARILDTVSDLLVQGQENLKKLAVNLARSAIRIECGERLSEAKRYIFDHGTIGDKSDCLELFLRLGREIDGREAEACLDGLDARRSERKWEYNERWHQWEQLLVLMIFGAMPLPVAERVLTYEPNSRGYELHRILQSLGVCGHPDALTALQRLKDHCIKLNRISDWADAVGLLGSEEAGHTLLSLQLDASVRSEWRGDWKACAVIARIAERENSLRERILEIAKEGSESDLKAISEVIRHVESEEWLNALLDLTADRLKLLSGAICDALQDMVVERRSVEGEAYLEELVPKEISELRSKLFTRTLEGGQITQICTMLLQAIDDWRDGYGEPINEARHPEISLRKPWPSIAQAAWDAADDICTC